jgi:hypothetical protein
MRVVAPWKDQVLLAEIVDNPTERRTIGAIAPPCATLLVSDHADPAD